MKSCPCIHLDVFGFLGYQWKCILCGLGAVVIPTMELLAKEGTMPQRYMKKATNLYVISCVRVTRKEGKIGQLKIKWGILRKWHTFISSSKGTDGKTMALIK